MAERVEEQLSQDTSAAEKAAEDLNVLFPNQTIPIGGKYILVQEYPFVKWLELKPQCLPIIEVLSTFADQEQIFIDDLIECFEDHFDLMKMLYSESIQQPIEFLAQLKADEMELLKQLQPSLENTGFVFDAFNSDSVQISGLPIAMLESEVSIVLEELISNLQNEIPESSFSQNDSIAKSMAKSLAVKTGTYLTDKEQENLVNSLFACKEPTVSPFQKNTFITLTVEDLDKRFAL